MSQESSTSLRNEAASVATPPSRLRGLATKFGREVAGNPNTPTDLLLKLAGRHFEAFVANPVLPLLLLEDPGFCARIPATTLRRLLRRVEMPESFLRTLERHADGEVRDGARWHVATCASVGETDGAVAEGLRRMPPNSGQISTLLAFGLVPARILEPLAASSNARLRNEVVAYLAKTTDPAAVELRQFLVDAGAIASERGVIRARAHLPEAALIRLAGGGTRARLLAARHALTPPNLRAWS